MVKVTIWHNATAMIEADGARILCDPWLVGRAYMGAWTQWPPLPGDIIERVGDCDSIWISHIHPDHYHPETLRAYMKRWGRKLVMAGPASGLAERITRDGFRWVPPIPDSTVQNGNAVDSAFVLGGVVNMNDNPFDEAQIERLLRQGRPKIALLPFSPAGPWPQTYYEHEDSLPGDGAMEQRAAQKRQLFLNRYAQYAEALNPEIAIPFAGQHALCGRLWRLNRWRGQSDALDAGYAFEAGGSVMIDDAGAAHFEGLRARRHPEPGPELAVLHLDYEHDYLAQTFKAAVRNAGDPPITFRFVIMPDRGGLPLNTFEARASDAPGTITIAIKRELFRLLITGHYHWSDAEIGSHYYTKREPDVYVRGHMEWLWNLHA